MQSLSYWVVKANEGEIREAKLFEKKESTLVKTLLSGVSTGTEKLVGKGNVPRSAFNFMSVPYMKGNFDLPIKYGYSLVGEPQSGDYKGSRIFVMHPHQNLCFVSNEDLFILPDEISNEKAILIPNMETALNAIWDAELKQKDRIGIVGAGTLGISVGFVLAAKDFNFVMIEKNTKRLKDSLELKWIPLSKSEASNQTQSYDIIFHTSGSSQGLQRSIDLGGFESRVIDLRWYGSNKVNLNLGESFHWERKKIISSQVSHIALPKRKLIKKKDRLKEVIDLLRDPVLNKFRRHEVGFNNLPRFMKQLYANKDVGWSPIINYQNIS